MAKKIRVHMYCSQCKRKTAHRVSTSEGEEVCICLACQGIPQEKECSKDGNPNRLDVRGREVDRLVEHERMRSQIPFIG